MRYTRLLGVSNRISLIFLAAPLVAGIVPNRYIVELSTESVAAHASRTQLRGRVFQTAAAAGQRALIRSEQAGVRRAVERLQGRVTGTVENVKNALLVEIDDARAAQLSALPGVRAVYPVREFHMVLDHALPLHHVPDAWTQVGVSNAGAGIRIGFIDSGIDIGHPGFHDGGFTAPAGFPLADTAADLAFTNNKVIVARSYARFFIADDPDPSARDHIGHGTGTAMTAAGVENAGPLATISGVAPQAWLGSYKVFGTPGVNDLASEDAILQAIDDAVADGMDVLNLSLGTEYAEQPSSDPEVQALEQASAAGVIVVAAAGNNGPDPQTVGSPGDAPSVIAVGAGNNDRLFAGTVQVPGGAALQAIPGNGHHPSAPVSAPLLDVGTLDGSGQACGALRPASLAGGIAFILRGVCTFEIKLNNARAAGAVGALVYNNVAGDPVAMGVGAATLPAQMISNADGLALRRQIGSGFAVTLTFDLQPFYTDPARLATFSAIGPNVDYGIKPDLVAVGQNVYTAAEAIDPKGALYDPSGYTVQSGTSFSAPLAAGAAALLRQARPGLTVAQYRSLLIDSASTAFYAPGTTARVQQGGAGLLNVFAALNATATAAPASLSFGVGGDVSAARSLTVTNVGTAVDQFQLAVAPRDPGAPAPQLPYSTVQLTPGASISVPIQFRASGMAPGEYEGYITVQGSQSSVATRVPYWYGVPSGRPVHITILYNAADHGGTFYAGGRADGAVLFRVTDASGLPVDMLPVVTAISGGGRVSGLSAAATVPNAYTFDARLGIYPGPNVFQIQAGDLSAIVTIVGN
jgi:hypothetical protein